VFTFGEGGSPVRIQIVGMRLFGVGLVLAAGSHLVARSARAESKKAAEGTVKLFNGKDLSGWYTFIRYKDATDPRTDPRGVFQVEDGLIHVSGEFFGCLTTTEEYENYRLKLDFKWGTKKWPPREKVVRDSGILMHVVGPDKVWPKSIECQIQEHDTGDFYMVGGTTIVADGVTEKSYKKKSKETEKPTGEWNTVEVICDGGSITHIVNGEVVNRGTNASVTRGKIVLQSEGAEIFYRNVELTPIKK
jgi:hypothetical protein